MLCCNRHCLMKFLVVHGSFFSVKNRNSIQDCFLKLLKCLQFKPTFSHDRIFFKINYHTPSNVPFHRTLQQQQMYPPSTPTPSPHLQSIQYQQSQNRRTTSFDGEFLPSSALEPDSTSAVYATSVFSAQQPWGYNTGAGGPPPSSPYTQQNQQNSHPQLRSPPRGRQGRGSGGPPGGGQQAPPNFYPAATPGPPIQTTHHNKGPEGANLFIFHIPNHFTNLDMWHLFCHYGNLLSVRIMVEKDTGRSRGFGFVSYDSPDAAALAIKELNGFVVSFYKSSIRGELCIYLSCMLNSLIFSVQIYHLTRIFPPFIINKKDWQQTPQGSTQANSTGRNEFTTRSCKPTTDLF